MIQIRYRHIEGFSVLSICLSNPFKTDISGYDIEITSAEPTYLMFESDNALYYYFYLKGTTILFSHHCDSPTHCVTAGHGAFLQNTFFASHI